MLHKPFIRISAALFTTLLVAGAAAAAPITYTLSASGSGTVNGVAFTNQAYSFVLQADTTTTTDSDHDNVFASGVITIAGTACAAGCTMSAPATYRFSTNIWNITAVIGIEQAAGGLPLLSEGLFASSPSINAPVSTVTASNTNGGAPYDTFATSGGPVQITTNTTNPTFSAAPPLAPVPTMSEWAMILFGLVLAGGAALYIQRRQSFA